MELNDKLGELAVSAKVVGEVKEVILGCEAHKIREILAETEPGRDFLEKFDHFMEKYGDRELSQGLGGLAAPTWREKPEVVWGMLKGLLLTDHSLASFKENVSRKRLEAEKKLQEFTSQGIGKLPPVRFIVIRLIEASRKYSVFRENSHFYLTQAMTVFSTLFRQIGNRLVRRGLLERENDIMYLNFFEVKSLLYDLYSAQKISKLELEEKIVSRKQKQKRRQNRWKTRNKSLEFSGADVLKGIGASTGVVTGNCKVITDPSQFSCLCPGDIMVAEYTNPAWTPVFSFIGGLVVEFGSTVSHAAIIAREYGIPAVMGVAGVTRILQNGELITIDGSQGLIQRERKKAAH